MESAPDIADRTGRAVSQSTIQASKPSNPHMQKDNPPHTKAEKRLAFAVAIRQGANIAEASRMVGISRITGSAWAAKIRGHDGLDRARASVVSKMEVAETLTSMVRAPDIDPRDRINALKSASDILGYNAPTRSEVTHRVVPVSVVAWLDSEDRMDAIDVEIAPALSTSTPAKLAP